jgi:hypothetical protein
MTVDRESEPRDPAEAGHTWFDTPSPGLASPPVGRTWFDRDPDPSPPEEEPDEGPGDADTGAEVVDAWLDPKRTAAILADVGLSALRDGLLPEPRASQVYWKLAGFESPPAGAPGPTPTARATGTSPAPRPRRTADEVRARYAKGVQAARAQGKVPTDQWVAEYLLLDERQIRRWRHDGLIRYAAEITDP